MPVLVIAEHDNQALRAATLNTVTAAARLGDDIHVLVAGSQCTKVSEQAARIAGVARVLAVDAVHYDHALAENLAAFIAKVAGPYSHIVAPATTTAKNVMPRVAALLDVAQISDIVAVESADTFVRPIYAGNVLATVRSADAIKVITVRTTAFAAAPAEGGAAMIDAIQMARELGMNPRKSGSLANDDQASWKRPLAEFIVHCYQRRFGRAMPERVQSLEEIVRSAEMKRKARQEGKVKRRAREFGRQTEHKNAETQSGRNTTGLTGL